MAGRRVARRRLASFVQQLDGSGGGSLLLARRQKSVVAKIGGVIKDSSSSSSSSLESFESQSGAFCPLKSADVHEVGVFVGSVSGEERPVFFKNLCAFFSERERERERERSRKRSDRAKNDAAR